MPKVDYETRQAEKLERAQELADKNRTKAKSDFKQSHNLADQIPMGQPILVGHHSEGMHRRHLKKIDNAMKRGIENNKKADYYDNKVKNLENAYAISQDDPEAIKKLKEKIQNLLVNQKKWRAVKVNPNAKSCFDEDSQNWKSVQLNSISAEIRRCKKRIETLKKLDKVQAQEWKNNNITLEINKDENRIMLYFPSKPDEETRTKLKRHGFRWSPRNTAWQSYINQWNLDFAKKDILKTT